MTMINKNDTGLKKEQRRELGDEREEKKKMQMNYDSMVLLYRE